MGVATSRRSLDGGHYWFAVPLMDHQQHQAKEPLHLLSDFLGLTGFYPAERLSCAPGKTIISMLNEEFKLEVGQRLNEGAPGIDC